MNPLSKRETIALMMNQLGRYYLMKYGYDPFILECTHVAKQYAPNDIESIILEADYETRLTLACIIHRGFLKKQLSMFSAFP